MAGIPDDYNTVPERIAEFRTKHPEGSLQPANPAEPFQVVTIGNATFIAYAAAAYRTPDDPRPGIGVAYEPFPGPTAFTRNSELQNAETSAWGRAIVAALAGDAKKGVSTSEEIAARRAEQDPSQRLQAPPRAKAKAKAKASPRQAAPSPDDYMPPGDDAPRRVGPSEHQTKHVMALFGELGYGKEDRAARLARTSAIVGREVGSWSDVTDDEADQVVDALRMELGR